MSMPNYLARIKSSGVYRYVFDKSVIPTSERNSLRVVVGYSEKGPFNTPVFIDNPADYKATYGTISRRLERKGSFFHRTCLQALETGPILALNLKPFDNETASMITFNASDLVMRSGFFDEFQPKPSDGKTDPKADSKTDPKADGKEKKEPIPWTPLVPAEEQCFMQDPMKLKPEEALIARMQAYGRDEAVDTIYDTNRFWKVTDNLMDIKSTTDDSTNPKPSDLMRIVQTSSKEDSVTIFMRPVRPHSFDVKLSDWFSVETRSEMPEYIRGLSSRLLSEFFMEIYVFRADFKNEQLFDEKNGTLGSYYNKKWYPLCKVEEVGSGTDKKKVVVTNPEYLDAYGRPGDALDMLASAPTSHFIGKYTGCILPMILDPNGRSISIDAIFNADHKIHKCLMTINEAILDQVLDLDLDCSDTIGTGEKSLKDSNIKEASNETSIPKIIRAFVSPISDEDIESGKAKYGAKAAVIGTYLQGFDYKTIGRAETGEDFVKHILGVLDNPGMREALSNNVDVDYKYWVDALQSYPGIAIKSKISSIVQDKFNALAILNFPPMRDCIKSVGNPNHVGGFDMNKVTNPSSGISLPANIQGASHCAFYTQVEIMEGSNKYIIPSAGLVSNLFMEKWASRLPYYIVAGPNYGRITDPAVIGPDYNYARADLDALEPFGVNAIVYIPRKGIVVNSNQTAKQVPVTALSKVHVRELVTFLQDTVEDMLRGYQWEFNTQELRDKVRAKCETYCDLIKANGGIYKYSVKCDETNNTPEVIDNEMLVVDLAIEPGRGCGRLVQTLTIHRTGGLK